MKSKEKTIRVSSLGYALMCLLARRDRTGYELALFTSSPRNFLVWSAGHSQIYPELAKLAKAALVDFSLVSQSHRPDKKVYRLTDEGYATLKEWVLEPPKRAPLRQELFLKSHGSWLADPARAADLFRHEAEIAEAEIGMIQEHRDRVTAQNDIDFPIGADHLLFGTFANIRFALDSRRQLIEWCHWMEAELEKAAARKKTA